MTCLKDEIRRTEVLIEQYERGIQTAEYFLKKHEKEVEHWQNNITKFKNTVKDKKEYLTQLKEGCLTVHLDK